MLLQPDVLGQPLKELFTMLSYIYLFTLIA
jgi:hypothetical protein